MQILLVSPYHDGSHAAWAEGYRRASQHEVMLLTLPGRFWKWRMHGGAVTLAREAVGRPPDVILATDMLDLTTFLALTRRWASDVPVALYMHENQLTYPLSPDPTTGAMRRQKGERDLHYAFINYSSMLAADRVFFNSRYHLEAFFEALPHFLKHFPDFNELDTIQLLYAKSSVLPVGVDLQRLVRAGQVGDESAVNRPVGFPPALPLLLWNQRWEYDKNPTAFFRALYTLVDEGIAFQAAICGQNFQQRPAEFEAARQRLGERIIHFGTATEEQYKRLLWQAAIVASTAWHEFFGMSVVEAIYCQSLPILPRRLSYPELLPEAFHDRCLYDNEEGLVARLRWALSHPAERAAMAAGCAAAVARFDWSEVGAIYDAALASLAGTLRPH